MVFIHEIDIQFWRYTFKKSGDNSEEATPGPISNTEVKLFSADDTWWEAAWESRTLPVFLYGTRKGRYEKGSAKNFEKS